MPYGWDKETIERELEEIESKIDSFPRFLLSNEQKRQFSQLVAGEECLSDMLYLLEQKEFETEEDSYQAFQKIFQEKRFPRKKSPSPAMLKKFFYQSFHNIPEAYRSMVEKAFPQFLLYDFGPIEQRQKNYTIEELMEITWDILKEAGDSEVLAAYEQMIHANPSPFQFQGKNALMQGNFFQVYALSFPIPTLRKTYIHCALQSTYHDLSCFVHEVFHAIFSDFDIAADATCGNYFFTEVEGFLAERIVERYWQKQGISPEVPAISKVNNCHNALASIEDMFLGDLLLKDASSRQFHFSKTNNRLAKLHSCYRTDASLVSQIYETSYIDKLMLFTSYLGSFDLMERYQENPEKVFQFLFRLKRERASLAEIFDWGIFSFGEGDFTKAEKEFQEAETFYQKHLGKK